MIDVSEICETCLSLGRRMCDIDGDILQSVCPGFQLSVTNKQVCWECRSLVHKWVKFRDRVVKAQETLADYSATETTSLTSLSQLCTITQPIISVQCTTEASLKKEFNMLEDQLEDDIKEEPDFDYEAPVESPFIEEPILCEDIKYCNEKKKKTINLEPVRVYVQENITKTNSNNKQTKYTTRSTVKPMKISIKKCSKPKKATVSKDGNIREKHKKPINEHSPLNSETDTADEFEDEKATAKKGTKIFRSVRVEKDKLIRLMNRTRRKRLFLHSKLYKCEDCMLLFKNIQLYQQHMKRHDESSGRFVCELCKLRFKTREYVRTHEEAHFLCIECMECHELFIANWDFSQHYNDYHAYRDIMCWKCILMFPTMREYRVHRNEVHRNRTEFTCDHCGKKLFSKNSLREHIKKLHSPKRVTTKCPICFRVLKGDWKYVQEHHMKRHTQPKQPLIKDENSFCVECNNQYSSVASYKKHIKEKHEEDNRSACPHCGKLFRNLKSHIDSTHSTELKYECPECDKKFKTNYSKNYHLRFSHAGMPKPRNKTCPKCNKTFGCKRQLEDHMNSHTGARPHVCVHCSATFGHRSALFTHTRLKHTRTNQ